MIVITTTLLSNGKNLEVDTTQVGCSSEQVYFWRYKDGTVELQPSKECFNELMNDESSFVLFYIHGFNTQPVDVIRNTQRFQSHFDETYPGVVNVVPIIWPCSNRIGILRDYFTDRDSADLSGVPLYRAMGKFYDWQVDNIRKGKTCYKSINILAHSMGNRVLKGAVRMFRERVDARVRIFDNVFCKAADINAVTIGEMGLPQITKKLVTYWSPDDVALNGSKLVNLSLSDGFVPMTPRLGAVGVDIRILEEHPNTYSINCDAINNQYDRALGHTYFFDPKNKQHLVMDSIMDCMVSYNYPKVQTANLAPLSTFNKVVGGLFKIKKLYDY